MDYDYNHDYYLLARERDRLGMGDFMISDHPFQRQPSVTDFYNPTRPAYLIRGAVTRVGGDMIRMNIDPLIIDTTNLDVKMMMVLRTIVKIYVDAGHVLGLEGIAPH